MSFMTCIALRPIVSDVLIISQNEVGGAPYTQAILGSIDANILPKKRVHNLVLCIGFYFEF